MQYVGTARLINPQTVTYTGTAGTTTNIISSQCYRVRIVCSSDAFVLDVDGPAFTVPTSATGHFFPAGSVEYLTVTPGQKIAAVQSSANGTMYVSEAV